MADDYTRISNPYNDSLARPPGGLSFATGGQNTDSGVAQQSQTAAQAGGNTAASSSAGGGPAQQASVASGGAISDITIDHSIQSKNWSPKKVGFYIDGQTGYAEFSKVFVSGEIEALTGSIGGWTINATTISSSGITIDSAGSISTSNFVSGPLGAGWSINSTGTAEFQNVTIRGSIRTSVFEKDTISAINGMILISKADVLDADMTALDASTLVISNQTTFVNNEVIRVKDGTDDEWMLVTDASGAPTYVVTRDLAAAYSANANPIWKKGTAVASMGVGTGTKTGYVLIDASSPQSGTGYSPYIDVYGRNSNTYTDTTLHARLGWLKGITDAAVGLSATDVWGLYTDNAYIKGVIVANTGYIGGSTGWTIAANSISSGTGATKVGLDNTVSGGDDVRIYAGSATPSSAPFRVTESGAVTASNMTITGGSLSIGGLSSIDSNGYATFIGVSSLNMKTYSSFENSNRFGTGTSGSGALTWGSGGVYIQTGATATSSAILNFTTGYYSFSNNPTFTCSILTNGIDNANGTGEAFFGIGSVAATGSGLTFNGGNSCLGFYFYKNAGVCTLYAKQSNGTNTATSSAITTVTDGDIFDFIIKVKSGTSVDYYYRVGSGGAGSFGSIQGPVTLSTYVPSDGYEQDCTYVTSNCGTAYTYDFNLFSTSYER